MDIPRIFNITESAHRIHNPLTPEKLATLGAALRLESGGRVLDLGSGSGEMLCTWARDHGITGIGIDMSQLFTEQARLRAVELGVADQVKFIHGDAAGYVSDEKAGVAACLGATWIAGGVVGTIELLAQSLRPGGIILIGEIGGNAEVEAARQVEAGRHGLVLEYGRHRSTFLPQVWEQLPEPSAFMAALKRKAGLVWPCHNRIGQVGVGLWGLTGQARNLWQNLG